MADIVASTEKVSDLDAEGAMDILRPVVKMMRQTIERHGGTVINILGDGVVALFGAPNTKEGHAFLACTAAIEIRDALKTNSGDVSARQGLHTGTVVFEFIASNSSSDLEAHGAALHLASRLQNAAPSNEIWITRDCYQLVSDYCTVVPKGWHQFRGFNYSVEIFELKSFDPSAANRRPKSKQLTPFRGREREMERLHECLRLAQHGTGSLVLIDGAAGIGKSRLCSEFAQSCRAQDIVVRTIQPQSYGQAAPLQLIVDLFRVLLELNANDFHEINKSKIHQELHGLGIHDRTSYRVICNLLGIPSTDHEGPVLGAHSRRNLIFRTLEKLLARHTGSPFVLIFEDVHWIDEGSKSFLSELCQIPNKSKLICIITYRSDHDRPPIGEQTCVSFHLDDMTPESIRALIGDLLADMPDRQAVADTIADRSGGNPYFAEELVNTIREHPGSFQSIVQTQLGRRPDTETLPSTLHAVIGERIDRLPISEKQILQVASVFGKGIPILILGHVACLPLQALSHDLERLSRSGFVQRRVGSDGETFSFRHPLVQEVSYRAQLRAERCRLHQIIAETMEIFYRDRLDEFSASIAYHYESAGSNHLAIRYTVRAARWVGSMYPKQAIKHWHDARRLLNSQPRDAANDPVRVQANAQIAWLGWREGMTTDPTNAYIREAMQLAESLSDPSIIPLLSFVEARIAAANGGSADAYIRQMEDALSARQNAEPLACAATLHTSLIQAYSWAGLINKALVASRDALNSLPYVQPFENEFLGYSVGHWAASLRARALVKAGRLREARKELDILVAMSEKETDPTVRFISHLAYVELASAIGDPSLALHHADKVVTITERDPTPYLRVYCHLCQGLKNKTLGHRHDAMSDFGLCYDLISATNAAREIEADVVSYLAELSAFAGESRQALQFANESIKIAEIRSSRMALCRSTIVLALCCSRSDREDGSDCASTYLTTATNLIAETGAHSLTALLVRARESKP